MRTLAVTAAAAALVVSGCAATPGNCDPSQADFFSGIACESSGAYSARNAQLNSNLAAARTNLQVERSRAAAGSIDLGAAQSEQNRAATSLVSLQRQNASLRAQLDAAARRQGADQVAVARQRAELAQLERDRDAAQRNGAGQDEVRELARRERAVADAVSGL